MISLDNSIKYCYSEAGLEAIVGRPIVAVLISALAEQEGVVIEEEVSLHGFKPGQLLHSHRCLFMAGPQAEAALHYHPAQLAEVALSKKQPLPDWSCSKYR